MRLSRRTEKLVGDRIELRRHDRENYPLYGKWYGDPEIWRLTSWAAAPLSPAAVERLFGERESSTKDDSFAIHRKGEREPLGVISLMNISETNASADLSVIVGRPEDQDVGYGTEAIRTILRYGFEELRLQRVGLSVFEFNTSAISTYQKIGFREEGRLRRVIERDDTYFDAILMRITGTEWAEAGGS